MAPEFHVGSTNYSLRTRLGKFRIVNGISSITGVGVITPCLGRQSLVCVTQKSPRGGEVDCWRNWILPWLPWRSDLPCFCIFVSFSECLLLHIFLVTFPIEVSENFTVLLQRDTRGHGNCDVVMRKSWLIYKREPSKYLLCWSYSVRYC